MKYTLTIMAFMASVAMGGVFFTMPASAAPAKAEVATIAANSTIPLCGSAQSIKGLGACKWY